MVMMNPHDDDKPGLANGNASALHWFLQKTFCGRPGLFIVPAHNRNIL
jgi:hypothetical protein